MTEDQPKVKHFVEEKKPKMPNVAFKHKDVCDHHGNYKADFDFNALDRKDVK